MESHKLRKKIIQKNARENEKVRRGMKNHRQNIDKRFKV